MHRLTQVSKDMRPIIEKWLDKHNVTFTKLEDGFSLFGCTPDMLKLVTQCAEILSPGFDLCEKVFEVAPEVPESSTDAVTWYQYAARVTAITGVRMSLNEMDVPLRWSEDTNGNFSYLIKRVTFRETTRRYIVTGTSLVMTRVTRESPKHNWEVDEISTECELEADLIKYGGVVTPSEYWKRRSENAAQVDWSKPGLAAALVKAQVLRQGGS